jgi:hypothetical protein
VVRNSEKVRERLSRKQPEDDRLNKILICCLDEDGVPSPYRTPQQFIEDLRETSKYANRFMPKKSENLFKSVHDKEVSDRRKAKKKLLEIAETVTGDDSSLSDSDKGALRPEGLENNQNPSRIISGTERSIWSNGSDGRKRRDASRPWDRTRP